MNRPTTRLLGMLATVAALEAAFAPTCVSGQLEFGLHGARAVDVFGGANGIGASVEVGFPMAPVSVLAAGDYFFPDCGSADGCSFRGASADLHFGLPFPVVQPYAAAGLAVRQSDAGGSSERVTHKGVGLGVGVNLGAVAIGAYAEARYEFVDPDDQFVLRLGIRF